MTKKKMGVQFKIGPVMIVFALMGLAAMVLAANWVYQNQLSPDAWRRGFDNMPKGVDDDGLPWLGAKEPNIIVYEFLDYECPHCPTGHKILRKLLASNDETLRIVRADYARMSCMPNSAENPRSSCALARAGICAQEQGRYWNWNDEVIENPRSSTTLHGNNYLFAAAKKAGLDIAKLERCLLEKSTIVKAQKIYAKAKKAGVYGTPEYVVENNKLNAQKLFKFLDDNL